MSLGWNQNVRILAFLDCLILFIVEFYISVMVKSYFCYTFRRTGPDFVSQRLHFSVLGVLRLVPTFLSSSEHNPPLYPVFLSKSG